MSTFDKFWFVRSLFLFSFWGGGWGASWWWWLFVMCLTIWKNLVNVHLELLVIIDFQFPLPVSLSIIWYQMSLKLIMMGQKKVPIFLFYPSGIKWVFWPHYIYQCNLNCPWDQALDTSGLSGTIITRFSDIICYFLFYSSDDCCFLWRHIFSWFRFWLPSSHPLFRFFFFPPQLFPTYEFLPAFCLRLLTFCDSFNETWAATTSFSPMAKW